MPNPARQIGFTLLELVITLAILAVLGASATPSFNALIDRQRLHAAARHLQADLALARHESGRRGLPVQLNFQPGAQPDTTAWALAISSIAGSPASPRLAA